MKFLEYESMVAEPDKEIPGLLDFLGLAFEVACLEPHKSERSAPTASIMQVPKPIYRSGNERWLPYLDYLGGDSVLFHSALKR